MPPPPSSSRLSFSATFRLKLGADTYTLWASPVCVHIMLAMLHWHCFCIEPSGSCPVWIVAMPREHLKRRSKVKRDSVLFMCICCEELKFQVLHRLKLKVHKLYGSTLLTVLQPIEEQRWKTGKLSWFFPSASLVPRMVQKFNQFRHSRILEMMFVACLDARMSWSVQVVELLLPCHSFVPWLLPAAANG